MRTYVSRLLNLIYHRNIRFQMYFCYTACSLMIRILTAYEIMAENKWKAHAHAYTSPAMRDATYLLLFKILLNELLHIDTP